MLLLALDIGSSAVKAAVLREHEIVAGPVRAGYRSRFEGVRAEIEPTELVAALRAAVAGLAGSTGDVDLIGLATLGPAWLAMDAAGTPLTPIITHADRRSVAEARELERIIGRRRHLALAGNRPYPGGIASTTWAWYLRHAPDVMRRADLVGQLPTYLHRRLTGARVIDPSHAAFLGVYRTVSLDGWSDELLAAVGGRVQQLPEVREAGVVAGVLTAAGARDLGLRPGTPMLTGCVDGSAAMLATAAAGATAATAAAGPAGPIRPIEPIRPIGPIGPTGPTGPTGPAGPTGPTGPTEAAGDSAAARATAATGPTAATEATGATEAGGATEAAGAVEATDAAGAGGPERGGPRPRSGQLVNVVGSTDVLAMCLDRPSPAEDLLTRPLGVGRTWLAVATLASAGSSLDWAHRTLFPELAPPRYWQLVAEVANAGRGAEPDAAAGVRFEPYLAGERMAIEERRASFTGLTLATTREHMLAAIVAGLARASADRLPRLARTGDPLGTVFVSGRLGEALTDVLHRDWPRLHAEGWRFLPLSEATLRGVAVLADGLR